MFDDKPGTIGMIQLRELTVSHHIQSNNVGQSLNMKRRDQERKERTLAKNSHPPGTLGLIDNDHSEWV